jgi:mRNA interferase YafQ
MRTPVVTGQFKRDVKRMLHRGKDRERLRRVLDRILEGERLEPALRDHWLRGELKGRRECHVEPDWLLIYLPRESEVVFERTGTHADLFE